MPPGDVPPGPPRSRGAVVGAAATSFVAGAAILTAEFAVVRVGAPWFGQSAFVWANAVGVVLLALAAGYAFGGRLAGRGAGWRASGASLGLAALLLGVAARAGAPLFAWLAPVEVAADRPLPLSLTGSLAATTALVGPACFLLASVAPILVARLAPGLGAGRAAGLVAATGTLGSLAGAAGTPLLLVPRLGARGSLAWAGVACVGAALAALRAGRREPRLRGGGGALAGAAGGTPFGLAAVAAALVGGAVTVLEFAASRALAPRFGSGNPTWAAVVAVVLVTLAAGNAVGGRWAARVSGAAGRARLALAVGAAWSVGAALLYPVVGAALAPTLAVGPGAPAVHGAGVVPAALLLFGAPMLLLGVASPVLVRDLAASRGAARAAGAVFAAGTLGSVAGCYLAPLVLLPDVGTRTTLLLAALALLAAAGVWPRAPEARSAAAPPVPTDPARADAVPASPAPYRLLVPGVAASALVVLAALLPAGPLRDDPGQLEERESSYQTLRVVETTEEGLVPGPWPLYGDTAALRTRALRFDEDRTSYQSLRVLEDERRVLTAGRYYDHLALGAWFEGMPWAREAPARPAVLVVGYGAGTFHRVLDLVAPEGGPRAEVTGVELDPEVLRVARERLGGLPPGGRVFSGADGRAVLEALPTGPAFDLVVVDAYQRTQYVPFHLATVEFFRACAARLAPTGAIGVNVNAPDGLSGALLAAVATTLGAALPDGGVWLVPNPQYPTNVVVWGLPGRRPPRVAGAAPETLAGPAHALDRLLVRSAGGTVVLTDERAPVERLSDEGLLRGDGP